MKNIIITALLILASITVSAQDKPKYEIKGNQIVKVESSQSKPKDEKTKLTHKIKDKVFEVYKSARGSYYILRVSKNTGKEYKQYLKID